MYKSAKGEIQHCQGRFSAYKVLGKTTLIHKGYVEEANKCLYLCVISRNKRFQTVPSFGASKELSVFPTLKDCREEVTVTSLVFKFEN